jgi:hypothetical protein
MKHNAFLLTIDVDTVSSFVGDGKIPQACWASLTQKVDCFGV